MAADPPPPPHESATRYAKTLTPADLAAVAAAFGISIDTLMELGRNAQMP